MFLNINLKDAFKFMYRYIYIYFFFNFISALMSLRPRFALLKNLHDDWWIFLTQSFYCFCCLNHNWVDWSSQLFSLIFSFLKQWNSILKHFFFFLISYVSLKCKQNKQKAIKMRKWKLKFFSYFFVVFVLFSFYFSQIK
jgi:hypothetical protein